MMRQTSMTLQEAAEKFISWLERQILFSGRGDELDVLDVEPSGRFWLGRLAPEDAVIALGLGDRGERLDPCATGIRIRPAAEPPWVFEVEAFMRCWMRGQDRKWRKSKPLRNRVQVSIPTGVYGDYSFGATDLAGALRSLTDSEDLKCEVRVEVRTDYEGRKELTIIIVKTSSAKASILAIQTLNKPCLELSTPTESLTLESLPAPFRMTAESMPMA